MQAPMNTKQDIVVWQRHITSWLGYHASTDAAAAAGRGLPASLLLPAVLVV